MLRLGIETFTKMPWFFPWSDAIKKRAIRYLLQRYVGQFLEEKLSLDQLTVDLYNGTGTIKELTIDVGALNDVADQLNLPIKFVDGYIGEICVSIPWHALLSESCFVEVSGLMVTVEPKQRAEDISMVDSMIESMNMTSSIQIAQECLSPRDEGDGMEDTTEKDSSQMIEGIEHFAQAIDTVLNRIKVRFLDTILRLEYAPKGSQCGVSLEVRIKKVDYLDEAGLGKTPTQESNRTVNEPSAFASKKFHIEGVTMYTDEFPAKSKSMAKSMIPTTDSNSSPESGGGSKVSGSGSGDSFKTADTSPAEDKQFEYNHEKTVKKLITNVSIPMEPILFAKLTGSQEICLKLKQADVMGPKIDLRMNCGSFIMFLSPRQIQLLLELSEGLASPDMTDIDYHVHRATGSVGIPCLSKEKPMDPNDFRKVENALLKELRDTASVSSHALNAQQGWSVTPLEDSDDDFVPMSSGISGIGKNMSSSELSGCSDMDSSFSSSMSGSTVKSSTVGAASPSFRYTGVGVMTGDHPMGGAGKKKSEHSGGKLIDDPSAIVTHFRVQISSMAAIILNEDILTPSVENSNMVSKASVAEMQAKSEDFFSTLGVHGLSGYSYNVFHEAKKKFTDACQINHIRLMAAPITMEGSEKILTNKWEMSVAMSIGSAEILECLVDSSVSPVKVEYSELLSFKESAKEPVNEIVYGGVVEPKLRINISQSQNMTSTGRPRRLSIPKLDIKVTLGDCTSEFDMSIVDRISALINRQEVCTKATGEVFSPEIPPSYLNNQACFKQTLDDATLRPETRTSIKVASSSLTVKLRFPIPDLRPTSNMDRVPWWKRNIRKDILSCVLQDFEFVTSLDPHMPYSSYELRSGDIHILFQEREEDAPISLLRATSSKGTERGFDLPRIVVISHPTEPWTSLEEETPRQENIMTKSMMGFLEEVNEMEPNPFSRRKVATQQPTDAHGHASELTIPSEKEEVLEFIENTLKNVQVHIEIHLPDVQLILPSKHIYEVIYNRLITDLLLWEPSAPKPASHCSRNLGATQGGLDLASVFMNESIYQSTTQFTLCTSANNAGSDSEEEVDSQFFSVYEHKAKQKLKQQQQQQQQELNKNKKQTQIAFKLTLGHAVASIRTPYRDSKNNVMPGQHGELMLIADQGTIFAAIGYQGNADLGYTCIWADKGHLYHKASNITSDMPVILDPITPLSTSRLDAIFYPNDPGVTTKLGAGGPKVEDSQDQIMIALQMDFDIIRNLKTIVLSGCVRGATLRHYMSASPESWVTQLGDMFDVQDYPIAGYILPDVVTEMNFHLWGCALDYRPLYLPIRMMLTVDAFSISSNLTISSDTNVLQFIIEDAALFLSDKLSLHSVDLKRNYVCVADIGVFELCLRMVEDLKEKKPKIDLVASNNMIHIRTCADSCRSLLELLIYLASDGDLTKEAAATTATALSTPSIATTNASSAASSPSSECATMKPTETQETLFNPRIRERDNQQLEMVRGMMDDAMIESTPSSSSCEEDENDPSTYLKKGVEVFFFPDENLKKNLATTATVQKDTSKAEETALEKAMTDTEYALKEALKEPLDSHFEEGSSGTDEEFCILDDAPGTGIKSPSGEPQVRILTEDPVNIIDNHFTVPHGKVDQLKAPKHFPAALLKYTLQELTVVWHMYGGSDFKSAQPASATSRRVTIKDSNGNPDSVDNYPAYATTRPRMVYIPTEPSVTVRGGDVHYSSGHVSPTAFKKSPPQSPQQRSRTVWQAAGGSGRQHDTLLELQLSKVRFQHEVYPESTQQASRNVLLIHDVEIRDRLTSSKINKFLYQFSSESRPRQAHANMVQVKSLTARPDGLHGPQETSLKISLQPVRLHIDQDALLFLFQFFEELLSSDKDGEVGEEERPQSATQVQAPIMTVNLNQAAQLSLSDDQQLLVNLEERTSLSETKECSVTDENVPVYFKSFVFSPDVLIKIDYHGKHVDINSQYGPLAGILIGLGQLNHSELTLKRIIHKSGLLGVDKLIQYLSNEWIGDIRRNQLPSVLGGVGPMHSLGKLFGGVRDLFLLPIEQYQKDGRVVRGIQRGTAAFTTSSAHAALDLTGRFVGCIQSAAETMYDMVSAGPRVRHRYRLRGGQPQDIREGVATAYGLVYDGIGDTASALYEAVSNEHQRKGITGAVGGVLRQLPPSVMQPIILASEAAGTVLGGMKNQLVPDARKEAADKWKA